MDHGSLGQRLFPSLEKLKSSEPHHLHERIYRVEILAPDWEPERELYTQATSKSVVRKRVATSLLTCGQITDHQEDQFEAGNPIEDSKPAWKGTVCDSTFPLSETKETVRKGGGWFKLETLYKQEQPIEGCSIYRVRGVLPESSEVYEFFHQASSPEVLRPHYERYRYTVLSIDYHSEWVIPKIYHSLADLPDDAPEGTTLYRLYDVIHLDRDLKRDAYIYARPDENPLELAEKAGFPYLAASPYEAESISSQDHDQTTDSQPRLIESPEHGIYSDLGKLLFNEVRMPEDEIYTALVNGKLPNLYCYAKTQDAAVEKFKVEPAACCVALLHFPLTADRTEQVFRSFAEQVALFAQVTNRHMAKNGEHYTKRIDGLTKECYDRIAGIWDHFGKYTADTRKMLAEHRDQLHAEVLKREDQVSALEEKIAELESDVTEFRLDIEKDVQRVDSDANLRIKQARDIAKCDLKESERLNQERFKKLEEAITRHSNRIAYLESRQEYLDSHALRRSTAADARSVPAGYASASEAAADYPHPCRIQQILDEMRALCA